MRKVVINTCFGGFSLSTKAVLRARELGAPWAEAAAGCALPGEVYGDGSVAGDWTSEHHHPNVLRHDPKLVQVVEELGEEADGRCAKLRVVKVSGQYRITEYDGYEGVETPEDISWEVA